MVGSYIRDNALFIWSFGSKALKILQPGIKYISSYFATLSSGNNAKYRTDFMYQAIYSCILGEREKAQKRGKRNPKLKISYVFNYS